jgi:purine catabolism regulator
MNGFELLRQFPDFSVCSGDKGLIEEIYTVTVMDAPDIYLWMHGNEFLITSGYVFKDDPVKFGNLIIKLKDRNVSALGIKIDRFIKDLPDSVAELSNKIKFPIIHIPNHYAFSDVINPAMSKILADNYLELKKSEKIHEDFNKLGIYGREINDILKLLSSILDRDVLYLNFKENKFYYCGELFKDIDYNIKDIIGELESRFFCIKVIFHSNVYGELFIGCKKEELKSLDFRTIDHASWMIKFYTQMKISNDHIIQKNKSEFVHDLLYNNIKCELRSSTQK